MRIDILKLVDEVDRYLFKRMDLTENELKTLSTLFAVATAATSAYMILATRYMRKQQKALRQLTAEIEGIKNAKGE